MNRSWLKTSCLSVIAICASGASPAVADCDWIEGLNFAGAQNTVYCSAIYDSGDGLGPSLYVGGAFRRIGGVDVNGLARWNVALGRWQAVGGGVSTVLASPQVAQPNIYAMTVYDPDGAVGPLPAKLIVAGTFNRAGTSTVNSIAGWDGTNWSPLGTGLSLVNTATGSISGCYALAVYNSAAGVPLLYAGGGFRNAGSVSGNGIAVWNGNTSTWSRLNNGVGIGEGSSTFPNWEAATLVHSLVVHDDGTGPALYIGGNFKKVNNVNTLYLAKWNNVTVQAVGATGGPADPVYSMISTPINGSASPRLVVGGKRSSLGQNTGTLVWDGVSWGAMAIDPAVTWYADILSLALHNTGSGPELYCSGSGNDVARWNGTVWVPAAGGIDGPPQTYIGNAQISNTPYTLISYDLDGSGPEGTSLIAGGSFQQIKGVLTRNIAALKQSTWHPLPAGLGVGAFNRPGVVTQVVSADPDGAGSASGPIMFFGDYDFLGGLYSNFVSTTNGTTFTSVPKFPTIDPVGAPIVGRGARWIDLDGTGPLAPVLAGYGGWDTGVQRWTGSSWADLIPGLNAALQMIMNDAGFISDIAVYDAGNGSGPQLYISGAFIPGNFVNGPTLVRWNGSALEEISTGLKNDPRVGRLIVHNDASGSSLFVAGTYYKTSTDQYAAFVAKWNGSAWSDVGGDFENSSGAPISIGDIAFFDFDGSGPQATKLVAGGSWETAGGVTAPSIAAWDGTAWVAVGERLYNPLYVGNPAVTATLNVLKVFDLDGAGPALYIGGTFVSASNPDIKSIAKLSGTAWQSLGAGVGRSPSYGGYINSIEGAYEPTGRALYVGGAFAGAGSTTSEGIAKWFCLTPACRADFNHSGTVTVNDIFAFLSAWFAGNPSADVNDSGTVTVNDIFFFLSRWFAGC